MKQQNYKRWYDHDPVLMQVINMLRNYQTELHAQAEAFLVKIEEKVSKETIDKFYEMVKPVAGNRWYDKDPVIKEFMNALERLDQETVSLLAQDFIQTMMEDEKISADSALQSLIKNVPPGYNRWYDKNYDLHSCLEVLKSLDPEHQKIVIEKFREAMYQLIATMYYGEEEDDK